MGELKCFAFYGDCASCGRATFHAFNTNRPLVSKCVLCQNDLEKAAAATRLLDRSAEERKALVAIAHAEYEKMEARYKSAKK